MKKLKLFIVIVPAIALVLNIPNVHAQLCFEPAVKYVTGDSTRLWSITNADFNNDGFLDLATGHIDTNYISIFLGTGTGTFVFTGNFVSGSCPTSIISADFNKDGNADLAVGAETGITILLGTGTGSFISGNNVSTSDYVSSVISADFNGDGNTDLAAANFDLGNVVVALGDGAGNFAIYETLPVGVNPNSIVSADFNGDNIADLAVANESSVDVSVLFGTGTGSFINAGNYVIGSGVWFQIWSINTGDYNRDGWSDLAVSTSGPSTPPNDPKVVVLLNDGAGNFGTMLNFFPTSDVNSFISVDLNQDNKIDFAMVATKVTILLDTGVCNFGSPYKFSVHPGARSITSGDFNGDGLPDLATANASSCSISVLINCTASNINQVAGQKKITIYPNPANNKLLITIADNSKITGVSIFDIQGNEIICTTKKEIDISNLQNGIYIVKVKTGKSVFTKKIIIQR